MGDRLSVHLRRNLIRKKVPGIATTKIALNKKYTITMETIEKSKNMTPTATRSVQHELHNTKTIATIGFPQCTGGNVVPKCGKTTIAMRQNY
jgi:hypothetical protein